MRTTELMSAILATLAAATASAGLPRVHEDQRVLYDYLAGLTAAELNVEKKGFPEAATAADLDEQFRAWLRLKGSQFNAASTVALPAEQFLLTSIERDGRVLTPLFASRAAGAAWLASWDAPCNPYRGSEALKRRAMVATIVDLLMLEGLHQKRNSCRSDLTCDALLRMTYTYKTAGDVLPARERAAFDAGLKRILQRVDNWGPTGINGNMDFFGVAALWYAWEATRDPACRKIATDYCEKLIGSGRYFTAAGYARDAGIPDMSYEGITRYYGTWGALATNLPIAKRALDMSYRLKAYTCVPEPDGVRVGPSHMSARTSADSAHDQYGYHYRDFGAAMLTDRALPWLKLPSRVELRGAPAAFLSRLNRVLKNAPGEPRPWSRKGFTRTLVYSAEHYRPGFAARLFELRAAEPLKFELPFERNEDFVEEIGQDFVSAKFGDTGAILYIGPASQYGGVSGIKSPWGFGGGQLSTFWTKKTGAPILGKRRDSYTRDGHDRWDEWRTWPSHAVSGQLSGASKVVSSIRIPRPRVARKTIRPDGFTLDLEGELPAKCKQQGQLMAAPMPYRRRFEMDRDGITVTTTVEGNGRDSFDELYETIPVLVEDTVHQKGAKPSRISFYASGEWHDASADATRAVTSVRIDRRKGSVFVRFDQPQTVRLSPSVWRQKKGWMGDARCRNVLIDLNGNAKGPFTRAAVRYVVTGRPGERDGKESHDVPARTSPTATATPEVAAPRPMPGAVDEFDLMLAARLKRCLAAGEKPKVLLSAFRRSVTVVAFDGQTLAVDAGAAAASVRFDRLSLSDKRRLAPVAAPTNDPLDHAIVAFYALADGDAATAREHLARSGEYAELVKRFFVE